MSLSSDIYDELSLLRNLEEQARNQLEFIKDQRIEKTDRICKSAMFDEYILVLITKLMSLYEKENYKTFLYKEYQTVKMNPKTKVEDYYIGIASEDNLNNLINQNDYDLADFFNNKQGFEIMYKKSDMKKTDEEKSQIVGDYHYDAESETNKPINFKFLLMEFNVHSKFSYLSSVYDFEDFNYIQDFISYIFELQYINNGEMLTCDELNNAFDNYLSLSQKKDKTMH